MMSANTAEDIPGSSVLKRHPLAFWRWPMYARRAFRSWRERLAERWERWCMEAEGELVRFALECKLRDIMYQQGGFVGG